jgi:hypothetical protein
MPPTAALALQGALTTGIEGDAALGLLLAGERVYSAGQVPDSAPRPYVVLGESSEFGRNKFQRRGVEGAETFHIWADDKETALLVYTHLVRLFDRTPLTYASEHGMVHRRGEMSLVTTLTDPLGPAHAIARYRVLSRVAV